MWIFNKQTKQKIIQQSEVELIDQIHNEFYSEVNILLNKASQFNEIENKKPELVDKRNRLYNLGFRNTSEMLEAEKEIKRLDQLEEDNKNKSDLIERIALKNPHLAEPLVEDAVKIMIDQMIEALSSGDRIEIRGFGSFALHHREPRLGRNPKTGKAVDVAAKAVPHFKPGKALRDAVNESIK